VLFWVGIKGAGMDRTVVTRAKPADGSQFRGAEMRLVEIGPHVSTHRSRRFKRERGYGQERAGIYLTPLSPREHPNVKAHFRAVRARIERRNGVLRQYASLTRTRGWRYHAGWQVYLSVLARFLTAVCNMARLRQDDKFRELTDEQRQTRLILIAGYIVERDRVPKLGPPEPAAASPP